MRTAKYPAPTRDNPLIIPYSALVLFRKCRKAYELGYEMRIDPGSSEAAQNGTAVHEYLADYARFGSVNPVEPGDLMWDVAMHYVGYRGLPGDNLLVEQPIYTKLLPNVYLRTTLDRVYREPGSGWVVGVDYKTFSKQPTNDFELDPQGGLYIAALMRKLKTDEVKFRYEYIRSVPPGTKNSKGAWAVDECYTTVEVIISKREADLFWSEAQDTARDLIRARREGRFYRGGTRVEFGSPCLGCFYKSLCIAEKNYGELTDDDIAVLAVGIKEPLTFWRVHDPRQKGPRDPGPGI